MAFFNNVSRFYNNASLGGPEAVIEERSPLDVHSANHVHFAVNATRPRQCVTKPTSTFFRGSLRTERESDRVFVFSAKYTMPKKEKEKEQCRK